MNLRYCKINRRLTLETEVSYTVRQTACPCWCPPAVTVTLHMITTALPLGKLIYWPFKMDVKRPIEANNM